jgi:hypothetical protein
MKSQSLITIGEIYDYNIGDIFQRTVGFSGPAKLRKTTITNKYYSALMDTVFYEYNEYNYTAPSCAPPCTFSSSLTTGNIISYTNLNDTVGIGLGTELAYLPSGCVDTTGYTGTWLDTMYYDSSFCNNLFTVVKIYDNGPWYDPVDTCWSFFEPHWGTAIYGKGLGTRYIYYNTCSEGGYPYCETGNSLFYYQKGSDSCGSSSPILNSPLYVSTIENTSDFSIRISPNPCKDIINLSRNCDKLELYDQKGRIRSEVFNTDKMDINNIESGIYILRLYDNKKELIAIRKIVKISN